jgi:hypothetical protein
MIGILIYVLILAIVAFVLWYITGLLPPPVQQPARVVVVVICAIFLIYILLQFAGGIPSHPRLRP